MSAISADRRFSLQKVRSPALSSRLVAVAGVFLIAAASGLGLTWVTLDSRAGFGSVQAGPWIAWPRSGAPDADAYTRAALARSGELPVGLGEGLAFTARRDSANRPLVAECVYRVVGRVPQTRAWTLTAETPEGGLLANPAQRHGFTSAELVRDQSGRFAIAVGREVRPGNWLPLGAERRFTLVLRLYDTPVSALATALDPALLPTIEREGCP